METRRESLVPQKADMKRGASRPPLTLAPCGFLLQKDWKGKSERAELITALSKWLPKKLWVVEISVPQLFPANERKLGEIVLNAEIEIGEGHGARSNFALARLPGLFYFSRGKNDFLTIPSAFTSHIQVIRL